MVGFAQAKTWCKALAALASVMSVSGLRIAHASDHLDTPTVIADPRADIGDVYAWMSPDARQLNLVMTIVGHSFSDKLQYVFHVDSGSRYGATTATISIACRFSSAKDADCRAGGADSVRGDASGPAGLEGHNRRFRVFAGLRDDPFFNNVKGTRAAYGRATQALKDGAGQDAAGCPNFDKATSRSILDEWRHTDGGPGKNFLAGWTPASVVISVDVDLVAKGGRMLAVWGATVGPDRQIDRAARPLTGNALLGTLAPEDVAFKLKEEYNAATPATAARFVGEIEKSLGLYDGFDGQCGNQLLADARAGTHAIESGAAPSANVPRYHALAELLADDRLWVNSASGVCTQLFAVELANLAGRRELSNDCGGRTPNYDAVNVYRSLLVDATNTSVDDGVHHDERVHSTTVFPFLAAPEANDRGAPQAGSY
jgi:hypothetical protein